MNITGEKVRVRDKNSEDSAMEIVWEQDAEIKDLNPHVGTVFHNNLFSIETLDGKHIGSCNLYNWTTHDVQLGIMIGDKDYWNKGYGTEAVGILVNYCFASASVDRVWLKVLLTNIRAIRCYEKCGFMQCGRLLLEGYDFTVMEIRK